MPLLYQTPHISVAPPLIVLPLESSCSWERDKAEGAMGMALGAGLEWGSRPTGGTSRAGQGRRVSKLQLRLGEHHTRGCEPHVCCMCLHVLCTSVHMSACAAFVCASRVCACAVHVPACAACHSVLCICVLHVCMCCACVCMYAACLSVLHVCACGMQVCVLHTSVHVLGTCLCSGGQTHAHTLLLHIFSDITLLP